MKIKQLVASIAGIVFATSSASAALTSWDFAADNAHGWTSVQGTAFLADNGVTAGQPDGEGIDGFFGGINNSGSTRNAHDGAHPNLIFRSPVINFGAASTTDTVLEINWHGGAGKQDGTNPAADPTSIMDPTSPADIIAGSTSGLEDGMKGLGLLNLTTGNYDAYSYKDNGNGNGDDIEAFTLAQLQGAGVSLTDDYQLDFFETDDGGWGWTRLQAVNIDEAAITGIPEPSSTMLLGLVGLLAFVRRRK